jgi:HEAT repeat protein
MYEQASQALAQIGEPAIPALIQAMHEAERWFGAAAALTAIGYPAIQPLIELMRGHSLGNFAVHALTNMGDIVIPTWISALSDSDDEVRMWAATALAWSLDPRAYDVLVARLDDPDRDVRAAVIEAIAELDRPEILPQLQAIQQIEQDDSVQQALDTAIKRLSS